ncbi:MAG TPA: SPOR domain-containing protein [Gemmatimonadales bacterium]|nr:SPOR domain-containing protein [Gemmatimonadales bacterium]
MTVRQSAPILSLLLLAACGGASGDAGHTPLALDRLPAASLLRIDPDGGRPELYHLPDLAPLDWKAEDRFAKVDHLVGSIAEPPQAILLDAAGKLTAMRLESGRTRTVVQGVAAAVVSADGSLYSVDSAGVPWTVGRRTPERYRGAFDQVPDRLWAGAGGWLVGLDSSASALEALGVSDTLSVIPIESGLVAAAPWADLIAVATDSAVWLHDPHSTGKPVRIPGIAGASGVAFSPSGHQLYVAARDRLVVVDRFAARVRTRVSLPAAARGLRPDPLGRWLLVRPASGDSIWVVDLDRDSLVGTVPGAWNRDLPLVASPNALVTRDGKRIVARDLTRSGFPETGRVDDAAASLWMTVPWSPVREDLAAAALAADSSDTTVADSTPGERIYLQVSSSRNPDWAGELVKKLADAGLDASILKPATDNDPYRVVLGPYPSRDAAEETGRTLGMPYFVISLPAATN